MLLDVLDISALELLMTRVDFFVVGVAGIVSVVCCNLVSVRYLVDFVAQFYNCDVYPSVDAFEVWLMLFEVVIDLVACTSEA